MEQSKASCISKIVILIVVFLVLNFFAIIFGNMLISGNEFIINEGEYTYDELFYSPNSEKDYYQFSKNYYEGNLKYIPGDDVFSNLKFIAVDKFEAMVMLSFIPKRAFLGWCNLTDKNMTEQELQEVYEKKDYVYYSYVYNIFGKTYLYGYLKDFVYIIDDEYSNEDNFYLATKTYNSNSVAFFEVEGLDLNVVKQGTDSNVIHHKGFVDVFNKPYSYIVVTVCLIEFAILLMVMKKRRRSY